MAPLWWKRRPPRDRFPPDWLAILQRNVPLYSRLPAADQAELQGRVRTFLDGKDFEGCGSFEITDEVRVTIAAHACLLLLHRQTDCFRSVSTILVYPSAYVVQERERLEDGVVSVGPAELVGEAWQHGPVILAWDEVLADATHQGGGHNVVLHEFAHKLDEEDGAMDGAPALGPAARYAAWARILASEYRRLRRDSAEGRRSVLDEYGAEDPAEFFAVATESFFGEPVLLRQRHPQLYQELAEFYRQDPAALLGGNAGSGLRNPE
jgi:Mlc titration factor MtfA (ptsG expression regulator)